MQLHFCKTFMSNDMFCLLTSLVASVQILVGIVRGCGVFFLFPPSANLTIKGSVHPVKTENLIH